MGTATIKSTGVFKYVEVEGEFKEDGAKVFKRKRMFRKTTKIKKYLSAE